MATIYDVADRAAVSAATVSRVLNGFPTVDPALAARVRKAVEELEYVPSAVARNLRKSKTTLWAVMVSDVGNPFFTSVVRGVEDVAQANGYSVVLCNTDEDPGKEDRYLSVALAEQMAGVILSPSGRARLLDRLMAAGVSVVAIDREVRDSRVDTVLVDNEQGARSATDHLLDAGYRRIACITGPRHVSTASMRLAGYRTALVTRGRAVDERLVRFADFREEGGYQAMISLLDQTPGPDAVFGGNNLMTVGAIEALVDRDVRIPGDIAVVGFDDIPWARLFRPAVTTVSQPTYEMGRAAALLLVERIAAPKRAPSTVTLSTQLHVRGSSAKRAHRMSRGGSVRGRGAPHR